MALFRLIIPERRKGIKVLKNYKEYKTPLREDFNNRCGYCDDPDSKNGGKRTYQIDHFVPRKHFLTIKENDYFNLVYACSFCNRGKWYHWPTKCEDIHHNGTEGFIDPCNDDYEKQFERNDCGEIKPKTELGTYMHEKLKLYLKRHAVIWNIDRLSNIKKAIKEELAGTDRSDLKEELLNLFLEEETYIKALEEENEK